MSCEKSKSCCTGECAGHCNNGNVSADEISLDTIVELEIHYSVSEEAEMAYFIFESLYTITNTQRKELKLTGLEGNRYDALDIMKLQVIDRMLHVDSASCKVYKDVDVIYIREDV